MYCRLRSLVADVGYLWHCLETLQVIY